MQRFLLIKLLIIVKYCTYRFTKRLVFEVFQQCQNVKIKSKKLNIVKYNIAISLFSR